jgi:hypothetical protein
MEEQMQSNAKNMMAGFPFPPKDKDAK